MTETRAVHVIVTGFVQGVGFRYHSLQEAQQLGLRGWVKNLANGNVELVLQGSPVAVSAMLAWLRKGPSHAEVTDVRVSETSPQAFTDFSIAR